MFANTLNCNFTNVGNDYNIILFPLKSGNWKNWILPSAGGIGDTELYIYPPSYSYQIISNIDIAYEIIGFSMYKELYALTIILLTMENIGKM